MLRLHNYNTKLRLCNHSITQKISLKKFNFSKKLFLLANINIKIFFKIFFLIFNNVKIQFA